MREQRLSVSRSSAQASDVVIERDVARLRAVAFGDRKLAGSSVQIQGDARLARAFFKLFARPT